MYKKTYKKACEKIKGDRDAILNKAFERAAQPEKKKSPILKYSIIGTAAAAMIVAGAVILNWEVFKIPMEDIVHEDASETVMEDSAEEAKDEASSEAKSAAPTATEEQTEEKEEKENAAEKPTQESDAPRTQSEEAEQHRTAPEDEEENAEEEIATEFVQSRGRSMTNETEELSEETDESEEPESSSASSSSTSGEEIAKTEIAYYDEEYDDTDDADDADDYDGGTMLLTMSGNGAAANAEVLMCEEYADYLGFDVREIELPEGMSFDGLEESVYEIYTDEEGNVTDDTALFTASGGEKAITIITTKMIALDEEFAVYENVAANVARNGDYAIYAVKNGAYVTIEFDNVESEEIDAVAAQLAE